jgi:hypothetical protein
VSKDTDAVQRYHVIWKSIRLVYTGYSIASIDFPDFCSLSVVEEFLDQIWIYVFEVRAKSRPPIHSLLQSYLRTAQFFVDQYRQHSQTFSDSMRAQANWIHWWTNPESAMTGDMPELPAASRNVGNAQGGSSQHDGLSAEVQKELKLLRKVVGQKGKGGGRANKRGNWVILAPGRNKGRGNKGKGKGKGRKGMRKRW